MDVFRVGVVVELMDRSVSGMGRLIRSLNLAKDATKGLNSAMKEIVAGGAIAAVGVGMAAGFMKAAHAAGELQTALTSVKVAGKFTTDQMKDIQKGVFDVSSQVAVSAREVASFAKIIQTSMPGKMSTGQLGGLLGPMAQFADVMFFQKGVDREQALRMGTSFAHLFGAYSPESLAPKLNQFFQASQMTTASPAELLETLSRFSLVGRGLGMKPEDQILMAAFMENLGLQGQGGTALKNVLLNSIPDIAKGARGSKKTAALSALGLLSGGKSTFIHDLPGGGVETDMFSLLQSLQGARGQLGATAFMGQMSAAFGKRGVQAAAAFGTPEIAQVLDMMRDRFKGMADISAAMKAHTETFAFRWAQMKTNIENIFIKVMLPVLPALASAAEVVGNIVTAIASVITPTSAKIIVSVFAGIATALTVIGSAVMLHGITALIGVLGGAGAVAGVAGAGGATLLGAIGALIGPVGWAALAIGGLVSAILLLGGKAKDTSEIIPGAPHAHEVMGDPDTWKFSGVSPISPNSAKRKGQFGKEDREWLEAARLAQFGLVPQLHVNIKHVHGTDKKAARSLAVEIQKALSGTGDAPGTLGESGHFNRRQ